MKDPFIQITDNNYKTSREKSSNLCALHPLHALRYFNFHFCVEQINIIMDKGCGWRSHLHQQHCRPFIANCINDPKCRFLWMFLGQTIIIITNWPVIWLLKQLVYYCLSDKQTDSYSKTEEKCV